MNTAWHEAHSTPVPESGCWLWLGANKGNGYGNVRVKSRNMTAHRRAYELAFGPVPAGVDVCHKCDTRLCINPSHLFLGSRLGNMLDAKKKGRLSCGNKHALKLCGERGPGAKLTRDQVVAIRDAIADGVKPKTIARIALVSIDSIRRIRSGDTWKEELLCAA